MIAEHADGGHAAAREVLVRAPRVLDDAVLVRDEVSRVGDDVGPQRPNSFECLEDVVVWHARPDVQVTELNERRAPQPRRQA